MEQPKFPVDAAHSLAWTEVAQGTRLDNHILANVGDPTSGSNFALVNDLYPFEKVSDRARSYVGAALEHLMLWADYAAPLRFHPDQVTQINLRPAYTLARAALESASQCVWLLDTTDPKECLRRHLSLINWDLREFRISRVGVEAKAAARAREAELIERVAPVFSEDQIAPPNGYLYVIQKATEAQELSVSRDDADRVWRAASGAAHGKYWPSIDLQDVIVGDEYEPGQFRSVKVPDAGKIAEALSIAQTVTQYGVLKFADYSGADIPALLEGARKWLGPQIPFKNDADPEIVARILGLSDDPAGT